MDRKEVSRKARMGAAGIVGVLAGALAAALSVVVNPIYAVVIAGAVVGLFACAFVGLVLHWPLRPRTRRLRRGS